MGSKTWPERTLESMIRHSGSEADLLRLSLDAPTAKDFVELSHLVWDLYSDHPADAPRLLSVLIRHDVPIIRASALYGLASMCHGMPVEFQPYLSESRAALKSCEPEERDAGAFGLKYSSFQDDEFRLWDLLKDRATMVVFSAAYSLRDSVRKEIDPLKFEHTIRNHPWFRIRAIVMERCIMQVALRPVARVVYSKFRRPLRETDLAGGEFDALWNVLESDCQVG